MEKLYYSLPYIKQFEGVVLSCVPGKGGRYEVLLDSTGFYPEGGGQPSDTGTLNGVRVLEVHEKGGDLVHYTEAALEPGAAVTGIIDWEARYSNMQHHTGEHILSGLVHSRFGYDNVGFHMGKEEVTIDFNGLISLEQLNALEEEANAVIYANLPVQVLYPSEAELKEMDYRSKKELSGQVRIVKVPGADICACCGTHVERTGEVGMIKCLGMIHYKGGVRIAMLCGLKALLDYRRKQQQIIRISNLLSAKPELAAEAVEKLKQESAGKDGQINQLNRLLLEMKAEKYPDSDRVLIVFEDQMPPALIRQYCTLLYEKDKGDIVLVCSGKGDEYQYAIGSKSVDMRGVSKALNAALNGRGGGSALMAQGTLKADQDVIRELAEQIGGEAKQDGIK